MPLSAAGLCDAEIITPGPAGVHHQVGCCGGGDDRHQHVNACAETSLHPENDKVTRGSRSLQSRHGDITPSSTVSKPSTINLSELP